jgi:hypothetical protein
VRSLRELQEQCYRAFLFGDTADVLPHLGGGRLPAATSLEVYHNNARELYRKVLAEVYPVIEKLVGKRCFQALAQRYMRVSPSRSGDLQWFPARFPAFLDREYGEGEFGYLPDVARLEWALEESALAPQSVPFAATELGSLTPQDFSRLRLELPAALRLVASRYPVLTIWRANQPDAEREVNLAGGAERVAVLRADGDVEMRLLSAEAHALAQCLQRKMTVGDACARLGETGQDFSSALASLALNGCLAGISAAGAAEIRNPG